MAFNYRNTVKFQSENKLVIEPS